MQDSSTSQGRTSGIVLIVSTLFSVFTMAHHPAVSAPTIGEALQQLKSFADLTAWVHGGLIALMLVSYCALVEFSMQRGVERPLVRAGLVFYGAGVVAMIGAASVSGWITPKVAGLFANPTDQDLHTLAALINYSGILNRTLADIGAVAMSAGIFFWSAGLLHSKGAARWVGALGILAGLAPALGLIAGGFHLNVQGMLAVVLIQAVWDIAVGVLLITDQAAPQDTQ